MDLNAFLLSLGRELELAAVLAELKYTDSKVCRSIASMYGGWLQAISKHQVAVMHAGGGAAVLLYMQQHVRKPLHALRHDNYGPFADLFTTALLQAAATGETLLDSGDSITAKTLKRLADKDASKIFKLNQRMQVLLLSISACCVSTCAQTS